MTATRIVRGTKISDQVYALLREQILSGRLQPLERLRERTIASDLGVSPTPVREALMRLEQHRIVESQPTGGARVRRVTTAEVAEILDVRAQLEGFATRAVASDLSPTGRSRLEQLHASAGAVKATDPAGYRELDVAFHRAIIELSGNATLVRIMSQLQDQIRIVMMASMQLVGRGPEVSFREHTDILAALAASEPDDAERLAREHVLLAKRTYLEQIDGASRGTGRA